MDRPLCCATCAFEKNHRCTNYGSGWQWPNWCYGLDDCCMAWIAKQDYHGEVPGRWFHDDLDAAEGDREKTAAVLDEYRDAAKVLVYICYYCGCEIMRDEGVDEHMVPVSRGGTAHRSNLVRACRSCNSLKSYMTASEFRRMLRARREDPAFLFWGERSENAELIAEARAKLGIDPVNEVAPDEDDPRSESWDAHVGKDAL